MNTKPRDVPYCGVDANKIHAARPKLRRTNTTYLMQFITERYKVHVKKDLKGKSPPWTKDKVIRKHRFTNVFREDDKVSQALIKQVSTNVALTFEEKVLNTFLFRAWNNPYTFTDFGGPWYSDEIYDGTDLKEMVRTRYKKLLKADPGRKWWSSAYNQGGMKRSWRTQNEGELSLSLHGKKGYEPDVPLRAFHVGPWLKAHDTFRRLLDAKDQQEAYDLIKEICGFSSFLAYQVFIDLTYIKDFPFSENEFVVAGPGCKLGLDFIFTDYDELTPEEAVFWLRDNLDNRFQALNKMGYGPVWNPVKLFSPRPEGDRCVNLMSLENCLCEVSKYIRVITEAGRTRCLYKPRKD